MNTLPTLFAADLHLSDDTPDLNALFYRFLEEQQGKAAALYLLGDIFDAWTGDDQHSRTAAETAAALSAFSQTAPVYFVCGNRDFLIGPDYAARAGMHLLPEQNLLHLHGNAILICHGDEMCSDDTAYQHYRRIIRNTWITRLLLSLPQSVRRRIADRLREASRKRKLRYGRHSPQTDVSEAGIRSALKRFPETEIIIHGHTHRPARHEHRFGNRTIQRFVLPDWYGTQGGYISVSGQGITMHTLGETAQKAA